MKKLITSLLLAINIPVLANMQISDLSPMSVHTTTTQNIVDALASRHYITTQLDDELSLIHI